MKTLNYLALAGLIACSQSSFAMQPPVIKTAAELTTARQKGTYKLELNNYLNFLDADKTMTVRARAALKLTYLKALAEVSTPAAGSSSSSTTTTTTTTTTTAAAPREVKIVASQPDKVAQIVAKLKELINDQGALTDARKDKQVRLMTGVTQAIGFGEDIEVNTPATLDMAKVKTALQADAKAGNKTPDALAKILFELYCAKISQEKGNPTDLTGELITMVNAAYAGLIPAGAGADDILTAAVIAAG